MVCKVYLSVYLYIFLKSQKHGVSLNEKGKAL